MPEISLFYGIRVTMYYNDHMPPHFHAEYNGQKALVDINNIQVIRGSLPNKQLRLILAWCTIHQDELMQNWELAKDMKLGLYVSGFWHIHAKTPRGTVVCEQ